MHELDHEQPHEHAHVHGHGGEADRVQIRHLGLSVGGYTVQVAALDVLLEVSARANARVVQRKLLAHAALNRADGGSDDASVLEWLKSTVRSWELDDLDGQVTLVNRAAGSGIKPGLEAALGGDLAILE